MRVVNVVEKFDPDGFLEQSWVLPASASAELRGLVDMTAEGWVIALWPVTAEIAAVIQPHVGEPIDVDSDSWVVGSEQASENS